tara:strand:- start:966 stop:1391 length:426 start_codon:yes stop_codon:yes gene_type:complete
MSKLLNSQGQPIKNKVDETKLPTLEQILKDPITKKFVFLNSPNHPDQTCIGLTEETDYHGVVYKYGQVTLPDEKFLDENDKLTLKFKYDILDNNGIPRENFGDEFFKLIGDILYHIIITQSEQNSEYPNDRTNNTQQSGSE